MESLAHLDAGIDLGEGHTVDDSAWLQAAAGAANESSGSDQDYDQADDQDDEDEGDNEDEELNQRHFGIFKALPVGDGDPDWSLGECLLTPPFTPLCTRPSRQLPVHTHIHVFAPAPPYHAQHPASCIICMHRITSKRAAPRHAMSCCAHGCMPPLSCHVGMMRCDVWCDEAAHHPALCAALQRSLTVPRSTYGVCALRPHAAPRSCVWIQLRLRPDHPTAGAAAIAAVQPSLPPRP